MEPILIAAAGLALLAALLFSLLALWGWLRLDSPQPSPLYDPPALPEGAQAVIWELGEAEALVVTRGAPGPDVPSVLYVPGFSEDHRFALLSLSEWMAAQPRFRLTVLLKRGYAPPFAAEAFERAAFAGTLPAESPRFTVAEDAALVRALLEVDPCEAVVLWGHSQGGATVQEAVTRHVDGRCELREELMGKVAGVVLEGSVMPGSGFSLLVGAAPGAMLAWPLVPLAPIGHSLDGALIGLARRNLQSAGRPDLAARLGVFDRNLYRFKRPRVALENGDSLRRFVRETSRMAVLTALHERGKLLGLFPSRRDLILDTWGNRRAICAAMGRDPSYEGEEPPLWVVDQTHFVCLERPELACDVLEAAFASGPHDAGAALAGDAGEGVAAVDDEG